MGQYETNFKESNEILPLMIGYVYLPAKQRCIGYTRGSSLYHDVRKAFEDEIIDVANAYNNTSSTAYLSSCTWDSVTNKDYPITHCDDAFGNSFSTEHVESASMPQDLNQTWYELQNMAQQ